MRRMGLMATGMALVMSVGFVGVAHAAAMASHVKPGGVWTETNVEGGCEEQNFAVGHSWTAPSQGDAGTYTGGGKTITESWTTGHDSGLTFSGKYSKSKKEYIGTFGGSFDNGDTGYIVKGVELTWNGYSCT